MSRRKFYVGATFGEWTIIEAPYKSKKALMRCSCGFELWNWLSNISSNGSTKCTNCVKKSPAQKTYTGVLGTAKRRGIKRDLTFEEWEKLSQQNCVYCGDSPNNMLTHAGYKYNGIDRIDSSRHYCLDNVVTACRVCNRAKSDMTEDELYGWAKRVASRIV